MKVRRGGERWGEFPKDGAGGGFRCFCNAGIASTLPLRASTSSSCSCVPGIRPAAETGTCWSPTTELPVLHHGRPSRGWAGRKAEPVGLGSRDPLAPARGGPASPGGAGQGGGGVGARAGGRVTRSFRGSRGAWGREGGRGRGGPEEKPQESRAGGGDGAQLPRKMADILLFV